MLRHCRHFAFRRSLFQRLANPPLREEKDTRHHEYSITPETFAFKVTHETQNPMKSSAARSISRPKSDLIRKSSASKKSDSDVTENASSELHPLQETNPPLNILHKMFRGATNYPFQDMKPQEVFDKYPLTNAARLSRMKHRPLKTKMLVSDFIEDSLYNPNYGYFSKEVEIFHTEKPFDYNTIEDVDQFMEEWESAYSRYDRKSEQAILSESTSREVSVYEKEPTLAPKPSDSKMAKYAKVIKTQDVIASGDLPQSKKSLQLWHTPSELFSPYYGEALARYIIVNYKLNGCYPYEDLVIYEMGGGNGTLMCNILNFIKNTEPDIYARTQYKIIEISSRLAVKQLSLALHQKLISKGLGSHKLEIINKSIFKWDTTVDQPCFIIALEVFDNFAHDIVRYDVATGEPYEGHVVVDGEGDFYQFYTPQLSQYTDAFLQLRENGEFSILLQVESFHGNLKKLQSMVPFFTDKDKIHPLLHSTHKLTWTNRFFPLKDNLTPGEFIPTRLLHFFQILKYRFPNHSLISSDFHTLTNTMPGYYNAPVVQTVINDQMVNVTTHLCLQGYFDIMFPTDFSLACDLYKKCTGKLAKVELHRDFLYQWADIEGTTTKKGENPMLDFYQNVCFMTS